MSKYEVFLKHKSHVGSEDGFKPVWLPDFLFDFQAALAEWALRRARAAIFADCGLGKTPIQLVWAENVVRRENKPVLILTPLAVSHQTIREADKFGIEVRRSQDGTVRSGIAITNYERLSYFNASDFAGVVCDESSILKSFDGTRRNQITEFLKKIQYRLLCTATAAPNDYIELGTSSEALGYLGHMDMLNRFFRNDNNTSDAKGRFYSGLRSGFEGQKWRFKGHAEIPFWRWVCSWARAIRKPSDLSFDDRHFILPHLTENEHYIETRTLAPGMLFPTPADGLPEQREERRRTLRERCEAVTEKVSHHRRSLIWCQLNDEGDLLEKIIPGAVQIKGSDSDEKKEEAFIAFADGSIARLVTKSSIAGWGLNFQSCSHITAFPTHSYEQYYQGVRRCWRFGQQHPVTVDIIATEGDRAVLENMRRKARAADAMFSRLIEEMNDAMKISGVVKFDEQEKVPTWLC